MLVTLAGMVTLIIVVQLLNATAAILVTGMPLMLSGITTSPPEPV
jgi:hypothetical protein